MYASTSTMMPEVTPARDAVHEDLAEQIGRDHKRWPGVERAPKEHYSFNRSSACWAAAATSGLASVVAAASAGNTAMLREKPSTSATRRRTSALSSFSSDSARSGATCRRNVEQIPEDDGAAATNRQAKRRAAEGCRRPRRASRSRSAAPAAHWSDRSALAHLLQRRQRLAIPPHAGESFNGETTHVVVRARELLLED